MELVSVVVPVYKVEPYLEKCVDSIRNQTYSDLEIILVDDGSPDRCGEMCEAYAEEDPRIRVIHQENGGQGAARNKGVEQARGKYLVFVDSDDWISADMIEKAVDAAERLQCDIVMFDYYFAEAEASEIREMDFPADQVMHITKNKELLFVPPAPWAKLFRREFYLKSGCRFPGHTYFEDLAVMPFLILAADRIVYMKDTLYYYRVRENSTMTGKNYEKSCTDKLTVMDGILAGFKTRSLYETYRDELEYLTFMNVYFEPSKTLVLEKADKKWLKKYKEYIFRVFPDFMQNRYISSFGKKDMLHLWILNHDQYWLMRVLSRGRQMYDRISGR